MVRTIYVHSISTVELLFLAVVSSILPSLRVIGEKFTPRLPHLAMSRRLGRRGSPNGRGVAHFAHPFPFPVVCGLVKRHAVPNGR